MVFSFISDQRTATGSLLRGSAATIAAIAAVAASPVQADELSVRQHADVCERRLTVQLDGAGPEAFTEAAVSQLLDEERARSDCAEARSFVVKGYADDRLVYQAIARAPRWALRSTPILSGADALARAEKPRPNPAQLPPVDGYSIRPLPDAGSECAQTMRFNLAGPAPMTDDNSRYVDAVVALAESAASACPQLASLVLQLPPGSGSRMSFFTVRSDRGWLPPAIYAQRRDANQKEYQQEHAWLNSRALPGPDTPNPLASMGYFASHELGRGIDFTLFEAWDEQRRFRQPGQLVVMHDARPADAAVVPLRFDARQQRYQVGQVFVDEFNDVVAESGRRLLNVQQSRHYVAGVQQPRGRIVNASHAPTLELPLFVVSYELRRTPQYSVPQAGLPRVLDVFRSVSSSGSLDSRGLFDGDARGADGVLTLTEIGAGE